MAKLVILGRDGVINHYAGEAITRIDDFQPISGSLEAISRLNHAGYRVAVVTHQPAIGEGQLDLDELNALHAHLHHLLGRVGGHLDGIFVCPHAELADCDCRKPEPGLLLSIASRFSASLENVPVIGRSREGVEAAIAAKARPVLVGYPEAADEQIAAASLLDEIPRFDDLSHAVEALLVD